MAEFIASRTLADALSAAQARNEEHARAQREQAKTLVDSLATAIALPPADFSAVDYDDDEDLDLPMLVQGDRYGALPETSVARRISASSAGVIGFGLGLVLVVPIGIVMTGAFNDFGLTSPLSSTKGETAASEQVQSSVVPASASEDRSVATLGGTTPNPVAADTRSVAARAPDALARAVAAASRFEDATPPATPLDRARAAIAAGDVEAARTSLEGLVAEGNPTALMLLAETFDPNMLAAWSVRGVIADPAIARELYRRAAALGIAQAKLRLEALE
jgi:hypothetical protein